MNCEKLRESLASYLYGELDEPARKAVEAHLAACPTCAAEVAELRQTMTALDQWDPPVAAIDEVSLRRAMRTAGSGGWRGTRRWVLSGGAGALAAVLAFAALVGTQAHITRQDGTLEISFYGEQNAGASELPQGEFLLLILEQTSAPVELDAAREDERVAEYRDWAVRLSGEGRSIDGQKLTETRYRLASSAGGTIETLAMEAQARAPTGDFLGGYFRISADSMEDALAVAKTCPHLKYGGRIEVREVDPRTR